MSILEKDISSAQDLDALASIMPEHLQNVDLKALLYEHNIPEKLVKYANETKEVGQQVMALSLVQNFIEEVHDMVNIYKTGVLELCITFLDGDTDVCIAALNLLQSLC